MIELNQILKLIENNKIPMQSTQDALNRKHLELSSFPWTKRYISGWWHPNKKPIYWDETGKINFIHF